MDNLRRFRSKDGTYDWKFTWKWSDALKPDLGLMSRYYAGSGGGCSLFADNEALVQTRNSSAQPLAGYDVDLIVVPFYFGYEDLFVLEETGNGSAGVNLWCGQMKSLLTFALSRSGAKVVLRRLPTSVSELFSQIPFNPNLLSLGIGFSADVFESYALKSYLRMGPFVTCQESGNLLTRKIYHRRDFAFLDTFNQEVWMAIVAALVTTSLLSTLMGRTNRSGLKSKRALIVRSREREFRWPHRIRGRHAKLIKSWPTFLLEFGGLLWGESSFTLDRYHRGLVSLWLLACTILVGCLSGSLRDMMSTASQVLVPEGWDDLWTGLWQNHTVIITPDSDILNVKFGRKVIDELKSEGRLITFPPSDSRGWSLASSDPLNYLKQFITILQDMRQHICILWRRLFLSTFWGTQAARQTFVEIIAYFYTDDDLEAAARQGDAALDEVWRHVTMSAGNSMTPLFYAYMRVVPVPVEKYVSRYLKGYQENGMAYLAGDGTDEKLESKILTHHVDKAGAEVLLIDDLYGPVLLDLALLGIACLVLCFEVIYSKVNGNKSH